MCAVLPEHDHQGFGEAPATPFIIAPPDAEVLPRLRRETLCDMLRRLPKDECQEALRTKIIRAVNLPGVQLHAVCGKPALAAARARGLGVIGYAEAEDLLAAARGVLSRELLREATFGLQRRWPKFSASRRLTPAQGLVLGAAGAAAVLAAALLPLSLTLIWVSALSGSFFLAVVALRILCLLPDRKSVV